jgi:hypothetical protein
MHQQLWGYKVEEKLYLGICEQKMVEYRWFRRLCEAQKRPAPFGEEMNLLPKMSIEPQIRGWPAHSVLTSRQHKSDT